MYTDNILAKFREWVGIYDKIYDFNKKLDSFKTYYPKFQGKNCLEKSPMVFKEYFSTICNVSVKGGWWISKPVTNINVKGFEKSESTSPPRKYQSNSSNQRVYPQKSSTGTEGVKQLANTQSSSTIVLFGS